ncbi:MULTISPECIES: alkene reductase [unclassified Rhodococcus (in: high G+C Gram-positive bacteria)]|uniref:alkene reductase n=1 Tax=unclassified Rhodococcus (in: high G+C Gram-positive bacteria) TaxID=192944 RepID=UPI00092940C7|nr:alkene reductase [Rhodococcus sp. M8]OLL19686.1 alkene reductase [Rhodococcus sp. M8]QPG43522.1 alkene reductase [Rhodococcus sp. M8]
MLFDTIKLGSIELPNRVVMAPMTRVRASETGMPSDSAALYYAQRASAGLIVSEGISPSKQGQSEPNIPGLYNDEQEAAWRPITQAVHDAGGRIFAQLMHGGRVGHPEISGMQPLGASPIAAQGTIFNSGGRLAFVTPVEMTVEQIQEQIAVFVDAAERAVAAGFDGVEIHGANGYLIQQFLSDNSNQRTDQYGGSNENRARFAVEVATAVSKAIGADRVGIRFSPGGKFHDMNESDPAGLYTTLLEALNPLGLAYLHILETASEEINDKLRELWTGPLIVNPAQVGSSTFVDKTDADRWLARGADLIAFGRYFISNPDLVRRLRDNLELAEPDLDTFYSGGDKGYIDYPEWSPTAVG